jgi:uncharacterized protein
MNTDAERRFMQRLNDDRNPGLAAAIDKLIREGRRVFAAVGALHMAGPKPVQKLLAEMGYSVERVDFSAPIEPAAAASKAPPKDSQKVAPKVAPKAESKAAPKVAPASK